MDWPLSCAKLTSPIILPSGNTIQEEFFDKFLVHNNVDPYNKNLRIKQKIKNRFVANVMEIVEEIEKSVENEEYRASCELNGNGIHSTKDVSMQADLFKRLPEDILEIQQLNDSISKLMIKNQNDLLKNRKS